MWIGGSDQSRESQFIWSKSKNIITFTKWFLDNPDNYKGNEDCIEMLAITGEWNDRSCDYNTGFICEKNLNWCTYMYINDLQEHCKSGSVFKTEHRL